MSAIILNSLHHLGGVEEVFTYGVRIHPGEDAATRGQHAIKNNTLFTCCKSFMVYIQLQDYCSACVRVWNGIDALTGLHLIE